MKGDATVCADPYVLFFRMVLFIIDVLQVLRVMLSPKYGIAAYRLF